MTRILAAAALFASFSMIACSAATGTEADTTNAAGGGASIESGSEYLLPWAAGVSHYEVQGNNGWDHTASLEMEYAFDFDMPEGTPILASRGGRVAHVRRDVTSGFCAHSSKSQSCENTVNYVVVDHGDGTSMLYLHISAADVNVGDHVERGQLIAHSGSTGWSFEPHLHMQLEGSSQYTWFTNSLPLSFAEVGVPAVGSYPVSQNREHGGGNGGGGTGCWSHTLAKQVADSTCVQSKDDMKWYECENDAWVSVEHCTNGSKWYGFCWANRLDKWLPPRACFQGTDNNWYQCGAEANWIIGAHDGQGALGACDGVYPL